MKISMKPAQNDRENERKPMIKCTIKLYPTNLFCLTLVGSFFATTVIWTFIIYFFCTNFAIFLVIFPQVTCYYVDWRLFFFYFSFLIAKASTYPAEAPTYIAEPSTYTINIKIHFIVSTHLKVTLVFYSNFSLLFLFFPYYFFLLSFHQLIDCH